MGHFMDDQEIEGHAKTRATGKPTSYFDNDVKVDPKTVARVKPCPFCGVDPQVMTSGDRSAGLMIHCIAENCPNPSVSYYDHETCLAVWNQRDGGRRAR